MVNEYTIGNLLKSNDSLRSLMSTATDEHLVWKQVYRADEPKDEVKIHYVGGYKQDAGVW
jgi:hypothetical protein